MMEGKMMRLLKHVWVRVLSFCSITSEISGKEPYIRHARVARLGQVV